MTKRVSSQLSTLLNPFSPKWPSETKQAGKTEHVEKQVQDALFGKRTPPEAMAEEYPELRALMKKLDGFRRKLAFLAGDPEKDYRLKMAHGTIAMIDQTGTIYMGVLFLKKFENLLDVLVGALAHEIGHRPKRWSTYKTQKQLSKEELHALCRYEETQADFFAGRAMAELGKNPHLLIQFLKEIEEGPHPEYFPAHMRAEVILEGYNEQTQKTKSRKKLKTIWPELDEKHNLKRHFGDG